MPPLRSILLNLIFCVCVLILIYAIYQAEDLVPRFTQRDKGKYRNHGNENGNEEKNGNEGGSGRTINVALIFARSSQNAALKQNARRMIGTLLRNTNERIHFHVVTDKDGGRVVRQSVQLARKDSAVTTYDISEMAQRLRGMISAMQAHFSPQPGAYYSDALFFLSAGLHRVLPSDVRRIIALDVDLYFRADISGLEAQFDEFGPRAIIGASAELSPVYRHVLYAYRGDNPGTTAGNPANPGLNSGVLLLDLERMRSSSTYEAYLGPDNVTGLADKYRFRGHLGDQDFYTLLSLDWPDGIHVLPCTWNRQLCRWWEQHGYKDVFADYFRCDARVNVYHGNCNSAIPDD